MIESQLDPGLDGTGEGYGNYPGLTVAQVADRYRTLAAEGHNRSVRAILRIAHEQTSARGTLGVQFYLLAIFATLTLVLGVLRLVAPEHSARLNFYFVACGIATLLLAVGVVSVRRSVRQNRLQVREIRRLALLALEQVVQSPDFHPKPLEREHLRTLNDLRRNDPARWARVSEALKLTAP